MELQLAKLEKDIGFIKENQEVRIKIDAFPFQRHGLLKGTVEKISADSFEDERFGAVYKIKVRIDKNSAKDMGLKEKLLSGMGVAVEVNIGKRRLIEFLIEPFIKNLDEAFKLR